MGDLKGLDYIVSGNVRNIRNLRAMEMGQDAAQVKCVVEDLVDRVAELQTENDTLAASVPDDALYVIEFSTDKGSTWKRPSSLLRPNLCGSKDIADTCVELWRYAPTVGKVLFRASPYVRATQAPALEAAARDALTALQQVLTEYDPYEAACNLDIEQIESVCAKLTEALDTP